MTNPVPGFAISTPYGKRGKYWSCNKDANGNGVHTGCDYAAPAGTTIVAARGGKVKHTSYGTAFGSKQFAILCSDGTEDFYAHTTTRPANGATVATGQAVAKVGAEGNVTGAHLHFERHPKQGSWSCSNHTNPQPSIDYQGANMAQDIYDYWYGGKPSANQTVTTAYSRVEKSTFDPPKAGWENRLLYINVTPKFADGKSVGVLRIRGVRKDGDMTAYHDYTIHKDALIDGKFLITHTYWESGDGQSSHWEVRVGGGIVSAVLGTRYAKVATVKDRG